MWHIGILFRYESNLRAWFLEIYPFILAEVFHESTFEMSGGRGKGRALLLGSVLGRMMEGEEGGRTLLRLWIRNATMM